MAQNGEAKQISVVCFSEEKSKFKAAEVGVFRGQGFRKEEEAQRSSVKSTWRFCQNTKLHILK